MRIPALLLALITIAATGCGDATSSIKYVNRPTGTEKIHSTQAAWQYADGGQREIVILNQWTIPSGEPVPDIEYFYLLVPDQPADYAAATAQVTAYRLTRENRHETLYQAVDGIIAIDHLDHGRISASINATFAPMATRSPQPHPADLDLPGDDPAARSRDAVSTSAMPRQPEALTVKLDLRIDQNPQLASSIITQHHRRVQTLKQQP